MRFFLLLNVFKSRFLHFLVILHYLHNTLSGLEKGMLTISKKRPLY